VATSRLGSIGISARPYAGFVAKDEAVTTPPALSRLAALGFSARAYRQFAAKTPQGAEAITGSGAMSAQAASTTGEAEREIVDVGAGDDLAAQSATTYGIGGLLRIGSGALVAQVAALVGLQSVTPSAMSSGVASMSGTGSVSGDPTPDYYQTSINGEFAYADTLNGRFDYQTTLSGRMK
jgi:hypothetical protein